MTRVAIEKYLIDLQAARAKQIVVDQALIGRRLARTHGAAMHGLWHWDRNCCISSHATPSTIGVLVPTPEFKSSLLPARLLHYGLLLVLEDSQVVVFGQSGFIDSSLSG